MRIRDNHYFVQQAAFVGLMLLSGAALADGAGSPTLMNMVTNLGTLSTVFVEALLWVMYGGGMYFLFQAITDSMKASTPQHASHITGGRIMSRMFWGGAFLAGGYLLDMLSGIGSLSGQWNGYGIYGDGHASGSNVFAQFLLAVTRLVQVYGGYAMFKGGMLWKAAGDGRDQSGEDKAASGGLHVLFGALCANIIELYTTVATFFGFTIPAFFPK